MENNMEYSGTFEEYISEIKDIIKWKNKQSGPVNYAITTLNFHVDEIEPNLRYFKECYELKQTPEVVLTNLKHNEDELYRKVSSISNAYILDEVSNRRLENVIIEDAWTGDLEDELEGRWDTKFVDKNSLSVTDLREMLFDKCGNAYTGKPKDVICEALGLYNSFGWTDEEIIEELRKFLKYNAH